MDEPSHEYRTAVVRVEIPSGDGDLIIELVEVGLCDDSDRLFGRATNTAEAGRLLVRWLDELAVRRR